MLEGEIHADLCVVGLGGSGLAAARRAGELGATVVGLDAGIVGGGAAGRNGGFLLAGAADFHHDAVRKWGREPAVAFYRRTLTELQRMVAETPEAVSLEGSLRVAESAEELDDCRAQLDQMRSDGFDAEWYVGSEGEGLLIPTDGTFQPLLRCRLLARAVLSSGATLFEQSRAIEIGDGQVTTSAGVVRCKSVVVAVDGGLELLIPELVGRARTARLQMLATAPTDELVTPFAVYSRYGYEYWQNTPTGGVALGGMRDRGGEAEWTANAAPSESIQSLLEAHLRERLGVSAPITHRWAGAVGYTEDGRPVFEQVRPGVWVIGGYSGTGNVVGAICGSAAAESALSGVPPQMGWWAP